MSAIYTAFLDELDHDDYKFKRIENNITYDDYITTLKQNILSNFKILMNNSGNGKLDKHKFTIQTNNSLTTKIELKLLNCMTSYVNPLNDNLSYHFVNSARYDETTKIMTINIQPPIQHELNTNNIVMLSNHGYIGDMLHNFSSLTYINRNIKLYEKIITPILNPHIYTNGEYKQSVSNELKKCNKTQFNAIDKLKHNIEIIHGPPGTGKSTTIANIIFGKIPDNHVILCTAVQNQAIESLLLKLLENNMNVIVMGNRERLKTASQQYSFEYLCENNEIITKNTKLIYELNGDIIKLKNIIKTMPQDTKKIVIGSTQNKLLTPIMKKYNIIERKTELELHDLLVQKLKQVTEDIATEKQNILKNVRVYLSTVASAYKLYALFGSTRKINTIILDEAGATTELNIPSLIRLQPTNIIMIGDHKQLQGFCNIPDYILQDKTYNISMMERMINSKRQHSMLSVQYRMNSYICELISDLFYNNMLVSDNSCIYDTNDEPIEWININGDENILDDYDKISEFNIDMKLLYNIKSDTSLYNKKEIQTVREICMDNKEKNILVLTPYNAQMYILKSILAEYKNIDVRSIDSSQGMESDIVIISLVKSNKKNKLGFLNNANRMCVMLSRAKHKLYIIGNYNMFKKCENKLWNKCARYCN